MTPEDDARVQEVWARDISCPDGPLPGAQLTAVTTPQGWCGRVWAVDPRRAAVATDAIAAAYDLPPTSVIMQQISQESVFVWGYLHPSGADYHRLWPQPVIDGAEYVDVQRVGTGPSLLDFVRLTEMAHKVRKDWLALRAGRPVEIGRFVRRQTMLRAGILDILPRTRPAAVRELLQRVGIPAESLAEDLLLALDYPVGDLPTMPRVLGVDFSADAPTKRT